MTETILKIEDNGGGFFITTDKQMIDLYIDMDSSCCEITGYFLTEDDTSEFIGAELLDVKIVDTLLENKEWKGEASGEMMFVNLETSKGVLQFVAYNDHNGYYGHTASVTSNQLEHSETL